jgi:hypothetical protein
MCSAASRSYPLPERVALLRRCPAFTCKSLLITSISACTHAVEQLTGGENVIRSFAGPAPRNGFVNVEVGWGHGHVRRVRCGVVHLATACPDSPFRFGSDADDDAT